MENLISRRTFFKAGVGTLATGAVLLAGCSSNSQSGNSQSSSSSSSSKSDVEVSEIKWARANSGNIFVTIAKQKGYFSEAGLTVNEMPINGDNEALTSLDGGQVDVTSNNGTNNPLQFIAKGSNFTIVGGYMLKGMYIVAKAGTGWNGVTDLLGKKIAGTAFYTPVTGAVLKAGHDPLKEIEWQTYSTASDRLAAVVAGETDYAILSGDLLYTVGNMKDIEIVTYLGDLTPNYGCCRINMKTDFVNNNPKTMHALMKALLKAECYFNANKDEAVSILAKEINAEEDYVAAYLKNPNYVPSVDPVKNQVIETWNVMLETGFLDEKAKDMDVTKYINTTYYKEALDELVKESKGTDDEAFYNERVTFFEANNNA